MEFLMTYGWAILLIAVVIGVLFQLGVFAGPQLPFVCLGNPSFLCANETFGSSGGLTITFGYTSGPPITITGLACNVTQAVPPKLPSVESSNMNITPGETTRLVFQCPVGVQQKIGQGTPIELWFYYTSGSTSGLEEQYARGYVKVDYLSLLWNVTEWTPSSNTVQLLPYGDVTANPASPTGTNALNTTTRSSDQGTRSNSGWANGTDYHNHDVYFGMETTLFPVSPLNLDNAPCSGPPYSSHAYTAVAYANMSAGTYNFTLVSDDATEIFYRQVGSGTWSSVFGGSAWKGQPPTVYTSNVALSAGEYELAVDYMDTCDPAGVSVLSISPAPRPPGV